ncbi:MAG: hypothetical protein JW894_05195 [Bacteroidales bacterium]|nr:hypothetical protein [Bacteroidales bacterium]
MLTRINLLLLIAFFISCNRAGDNIENPPVARVYDKYLYKSQIENIVPGGLTVEDSLLVVRDHIEKWIRQQLLLHQANLQLTEDEKNVEKQISDYQTSLLIFKYEQNFIKNYLDTLIEENEIVDYYTSYSSNFILNNDLIKGRFIKVDRNAPELYKLRRWYRSDDPEHIKELESYCYNNAEIYKYFDEDWIYFSEIIGMMPELHTRPESILKYWKNYEMKDTTSFYLLKITDYKLAGSVAPIELVRVDIKSILINKRKIQLIHQLESDVYNNALNRDNFSIY